MGVTAVHLDRRRSEERKEREKEEESAGGGDYHRRKPPKPMVPVVAPPRQSHARRWRWRTRPPLSLSPDVYATASDSRERVKLQSNDGREEGRERDGSPARRSRDWLSADTRKRSRQVEKEAAAAAVVEEVRKSLVSFSFCEPVMG